MLSASSLFFHRNISEQLTGAHKTFMASVARSNNGKIASYRGKADENGCQEVMSESSLDALPPITRTNWVKKRPFPVRKIDRVPFQFSLKASKLISPELLFFA